ncbi:MAG: NERD domain-containing protein [Thiothrix sp.]|uniref:NERD domain-containing protein n=1 Tax=Thiothrix sp. TaxID=1032 RepID=UPI00261479F7|nr:NERD domain-containing protein [Thiothrix sp.]MDD5395553.1 NERD domain-containing protein [Thiothrix sp.]
MSFAAGFKGWLGEAALSVAKKIALNGDIYREVNNVTIATANGTTQIDHIIVSRYGIFVIETKNMEGWIFGAEAQPKWTQSFRKSKFQFQNPLHQNFRHIKALEEFLGLPPSMFHSIVCFVGETCKLKTELPDNVICGGPFGYIKAKIEVLLPDAQIVEIVEAIKTGMRPKNFLGLSTRETKQEHLASLKDRHSSTTTCPKCGGELILRTIKKGEKSGQQFYGCGKFPACRYMRSIVEK